MDKERILKNKISLINGICPLLVSVVAAVIISLCFGYRFSSNDDALLRSIASGSYTGTPDAHLVYILYPLGLIFKGLYTIAPGIVWYDLFMTGMHYLCWFLISAFFCGSFKSVRGKVLSSILTVLALSAVDLKYMIMHQYTVLAGVILATAVLYCLDGKSRKNGIISLILAIVGLWLRKEVFIMALPLFVLVFIYKGKKKIKPLHIVVAGIALLSVVIDFAAYSGDDWKAYREYNEARTKCYDYAKLPEYESSQAVYDSLGISSSEYEVLAHMMDVSLTDEVDAKDFNALSAAYDEIIREWQKYYSVPRKLIKDTAMAIASEPARQAQLVMLFAAAFLVVFLLVLKDYRGLGITAIIYLYRLTFTAYFVYKGRFIERVSFSLIIMVTLIYAGLLVRASLKIFKSDSIASMAMVTVTSIMICAFMVLGLILIMPIWRQNVTLVKCMDEIRAYTDTYPNRTFVMNTYSVATYPSEMFGNLPDADNVLTAGSWLTKSPLERKLLERNGMDNLQDGIIDENGPLFIAWDMLGYEWIADFYRNKGIPVEIHKVGTIELADERVLNVYKIKRIVTATACK